MRHPNQHHFWYCAIGSSMAGEGRHPQIVVRELAASLGFRILDAVPQSIADGWDFWIEFDGDLVFPDYFSKRPWKPIGQV